MLYYLSTTKVSKVGEYFRVKTTILTFPVFDAGYFYDDDKNIHIAWLDCESRFKRLGFCTYIIKYIKNEAKNNNSKMITLDVFYNNDIAINCYKKMGLYIDQLVIYLLLWNIYYKLILLKKFII